MQIGLWPFVSEVAASSSFFASLCLWLHTVASLCSWFCCSWFPAVTLPSFLTTIHSSSASSVLVLLQICGTWESRWNRSWWLSLLGFLSSLSSFVDEDFGEPGSMSCLNRLIRSSFSTFLCWQSGGAHSCLRQFLNSMTAWVVAWAVLITCPTSTATFSSLMMTRKNSFA